MSAAAFNLPLLYADFSDRRPGDVVELPLAYLERHEVNAIVERHRGKVLESVSRKLTASFHRPQDALACAHEVRASVFRFRGMDATRRFLGCRILLSYGEVKNNDQPAAEKLAYELSWHLSNAPQDTIVATKDFVDKLPTLPFPTPRQIGKVAPGREPLMLVAAADNKSMEDEGETRTGSIMAAATVGHFTELTLRVGRSTRTVNPPDCPISVGRSKTCGLMVQGDSVSRVHGHIDYKNDKFYYVDESRNGSFVLLQDGRELRITGENVVLAGDGVISLGLPINDQVGEVIRYHCMPLKLSLDADTKPRRPGEDSTQKMR
ncbi:MAG TPA: FHA domain-containing protein [Solimonas sp.]|nr:FHA domain-containing protein [Solimonas sp.]